MEPLHLLWFLYVHSSVSCSFSSPLGLSPHSGMWQLCMHPTRQLPDNRCGCFLSMLYLSTCHANAFFFFLPNLHGFLLSRILPLACVGKLDLPAVSRGPSPLPEPAPAGDIVTGESSCFTFTASLFSFLFYEGCSQTSFCMVLGSACTCRPDLYFQRMHASRMWIHS